MLFNKNAVLKLFAILMQSTLHDEDIHIHALKPRVSSHRHVVDRIIMRVSIKDEFPLQFI